MKDHQRIIIKFLHNEQVDSNEIYTRLQAQFGEDTYSLRSVQRWIQYFRLGRQKIDDEIREGRPPIDHVDANILEELSKNPFHSVRSLCEAINCSSTTIFRHLHDSLQMKFLHFKLVPYHLSQSLREKRCELGRQQLKILQSQKRNGFKQIITGDESWFYMTYDHSKRWAVSLDNDEVFTNTGFQVQKFMFTIMWNPSGFHIIDIMRPKERFNTDYHINNIVRPLAEIFGQSTRKKLSKYLILHLDNARPHNSKRAQDEYDSLSMRRLPHPPYSPDIAPSDFYLFGVIKAKLKGMSFDQPEELYDAIIEILSEISTDELLKVFLHWIERLNWIIENGGVTTHHNNKKILFTL